MEMGRKTNTPRLGSYEKDWIDRFTTSVMRSFLLQPPNDYYDVTLGECFSSAVREVRGLKTFINSES